MVTLREQLYAWRSVIFALFLRELQSKFNDKFGLSWAFLEPFVFISALSFLRGLISGTDAHGLPVAIFMMVGMVFLQLFTTTLQSVSISIRKNKPLYAFRQVQPIAAILTAGFVELIIKIVVVAMLIVTLFLIDMTININNLLVLVILFFTVWLFSVCIGLIFGIAAAFVPEVDKIKSLLTRPLMFISCVFYSLQDIPEEYWYLLTWNPLVHFIEYGRYAILEGYGDRGISIDFMIASAILSLFFSLALYHLTWRKVLAR